MNLARLVDAVRDAIYRCCRDRDGDMWMPIDIISIDESSAVVCHGVQTYQATYTVADGEIQMQPRSEWQPVELIVQPSMTIKSLGADRIGGYVVLFGSAEQLDLHGEYFTKSTNFWLDAWSERPHIYDHSLGVPTDFDPVIGTWKKVVMTDHGLWAEGELARNHAYREQIKKLFESEALAASTDSAPHLVRKKKAGKAVEITQWPVLAISSTPTPAEPRLQPLATIKSAYAAAGLAWPDRLSDSDATGSATGTDVQASDRAAAIKARLDQLEDSPMTLQELLAAAKAAIKSGNLDEAETLTRQAEALKRVEALEAESQPATTPTTKSGQPVRPPFDSPTQPDAAPEQAAAKAFALQRYGDKVTACEQIAKELYGEDYSATAYAKHRDFNRYLRTGVSEAGMARTLLLTPGQIVDIYASGLTVSEIKSVMQESIGELGGYMVPEDYRLQLIQRLPGLTVMRNLATVETTTSNVFERPKLTGGDSRYIGNVRVTWVDESPTAGTAATNATFGKISIPIHTVMAETFLTRSMVEDGGTALIDSLIAEMMAAFALNEDEQFLVGDGVGKPQGILNGTAANGAPFDSDVTIINSGGASTLTADGLLAMPYALDAQYRQNGGTWIMAKDTVGTIRKLKGTDRYFWADNTNQLAAGEPERLLGYAIRESEAMPAVAANKYPILFGDYQGYSIVDRIGLSIERYLDSATARIDQVLYIGRRRLGGRTMQGYRIATQKVAA